MAWAPSTDFENDLVDYQPDLHFVHGQMAYIAKRKAEFTPRPAQTYEYLAMREKRNDAKKKESGSRTAEIIDSLAMMERIQQIAGTRPLGEHASMSDWEDTSTVEQEAIAMMRHFGMMSMADGSLETTTPQPQKLPPNGIYVIRNGRHRFPLIMDPDYFEPGRKRKNPQKNVSLKSDSDGSNVTAETESNKDDDESYEEIPYELLEEEEDEI